MADKMPDWNKMNLEQLKKQAAAMWQGLQEKRKTKDNIMIGLFFAGMAGAIWLFSQAAERLEKRGAMLQAEWRLKYTKGGQPRPEYWQGRTLTEQSEELSWVKLLEENAKHEKLNIERRGK